MKGKIIIILRLLVSLMFVVFYIPHILLGYNNAKVESDLRNLNIRLPKFFLLIYSIHNDKYFRRLFYHRIGLSKSYLISKYCPGERYFQINFDTKIGASFKYYHPYATIINAESIGDNFVCLHCTTIGETIEGKPSIGDNVTLGANVTIIGKCHVGNNVTIGAGSVVVKDIPDNCIVVGNPARVIKMKPV